MKPILKEDLLKYRFLSNICANAAGTDAAFVQHRMVKNGYRTDVYHIDVATGAVKQLTKDGFSSAPAWDDEDTLMIHGKSAKGTRFVRVNVRTGEMAEAFEVKYPVSMIRPLGDGRYLLKAEVDLKTEGKTDAEIAAESDYIVVDEVPFWDNGAGYVTRLRNTLFLFDEAKKELTAITPKFFQTGSVAVLDGKVYYVGHEYDALEQQYTGLFAYDLATVETKTLIPADHLRVSAAYAAGGALYFTATDMKTYGNGERGAFHVLDASAPDGYRRIAGNELSLYNSVSSDCRRGGGAAMGQWQGRLLYTATEVSVCNLHAIDAQGQISDLAPFAGTVECFAVAGDKVLFVGMKNGQLQEIWQYDSATRDYRPLTHFNAAKLRGKYVGKPEYCGFVNSDGVQIDGWVIKPIDFEPNRRYPGVLTMHGGPRVAWGELFVHEMQMLAGAGYFVFYCNPRGSDGRGEAFADLRGRYGDIDFKDFMEFTDHVLDVYPQMQADRLSAIGGSYGGFMANWMVGNTDRFAAIVSQRSFCNPLSDFGYSCIGYTFDQDQFAANPWSDPWKMWEHAPLKYACHAVTPTLFIHSLEDYNCPLPEGLQMFTALKYHGCEAKMCLFKGENHELSRSGKPLHRMRRLQEIQGWLDAHLKD
ncbi:MAG: S9 family peptidase [Clostridia bacterium]|nr:S9 family peptidase [Clostridia bacterium]